MLESLTAFLLILNPFALCLYLAHVAEELHVGEFVRVFLQASLVSFTAFAIFVVAGEPLLVQVIGVRPEAMRIFGGIIFFVVAYEYVTKGFRAVAMLRGSLSELPSAIALPFMVGAGTITQSILLGKRHPTAVAMAVLGLALAITVLIVVGFKLLRDSVQGTREQIFDRYVNILSRINGLLIGAISTDMVVTGVRRLWLQS